MGAGAGDGGAGLGTVAGSGRVEEASVLGALIADFAGAGLVLAAAGSVGGPRGAGEGFGAVGGWGFLRI